MGVNPLPTGGIYKNFTFDGETSASFGVHLTGEGVYNAPERAVEMVNIPARNGAFALDQGYFENIEVTYKAAIVADSEADFRTAISEFRNFLCSKTGYCRLEDDYNPNEYRLAVYKSGLEVTPFTLRTGEFNIVFDCKPQRFLKSGETPEPITIGIPETITNPTRFESHPLVKIYGYGDINIGDYTISVADVPMGIIKASNAYKTANNSIEVMFSKTYANSADSILIDGANTYIGNTVLNMRPDATIVSANCTATGTGVTVVGSASATSNSAEFVVSLNQDNALRFLYGTQASVTATASVSVTFSDGTTNTGTLSITLSYDGDQHIYLSFTRSAFTNVANYAYITSLGMITIDSTKSATTPAYIDLDTGECYRVSGDEVTSINNAVILPAELPFLPPGNTEISILNQHFSLVEITPRWWTV